MTASWLLALAAVAGVDGGWANPTPERCVRAPLTAGQSWVEDVWLRQDRAWSGTGEVPGKSTERFHGRRRVTVVATTDAGVTLAAEPLVVGDAGAAQGLPSEPRWTGGSASRWSESLLWPDGHPPALGAILDGRALSASDARFRSRIGRTHRLGPAHVLGLIGEVGDGSASCGGLAEEEADTVGGSVVVLDGTALVVAADLTETDSTSRRRHYVDTDEDGGTVVFDSQSSSVQVTRWILELSCEGVASPPR
jgi:hypothetical protein